MILVISPAKTLDFTPVEDAPATAPLFTPDTAHLSRQARKLRRADLKRLMSISDDLADLNRERFQAFDPKSSGGVQAAFAFAGDVYTGLKARELDEGGLAYAQAHLRILSGLYGLLRPLDRIQPYRLEMGTRLANKRGEDLYDFWDDRIAKALGKEAKAHADRTIVNLASQEYFGAVKKTALKVPLVACRFLEEREGEARIISFFAKKARGTMARWANDNRIETASELKDFDVDGYSFRPAMSKDADWVFARPQP